MPSRCVVNWLPCMDMDLPGTLFLCVALPERLPPPLPSRAPIQSHLKRIPACVAPLNPGTPIHLPFTLSLYLSTYRTSSISSTLLVPLPPASHILTPS